MVVPPGVAVAYVLYMKRATEAGVFWGMFLGYCAGLAWFGLVHAATWLGLGSSGDAELWRRIAYVLFVEGGGVDPSYAATLIPVVAIPLISLMTSQNVEARESFFAVLNSKDTGAAPTASAKSAAS